MKQYRQPKAGTDSKQVDKDLQKQDIPKDVRIFSMLQFLKYTYRGKTDNEWQ